MKKYFWLAFAIVALFVSCSKTDELDMIGTEDFTGSIAETRAELDGAAVLWNMGDEVTIFTKTAHNRQYRVKDLSNGNRSATFGYVGYTGEDGTAISSKYAVYPYDVNASLSGDVITTMFNGEQVYNAEKVDLVNALMVAKSQTTALQFVNAASLLRFNVKKNIPDNYTLQSIKLTSASNKLSGEVTIDLASDSKAVVASTGSNEIALTGINTVITQEEQSFYIALPATTFAANDLSVTITFDEDVKVFKLPAFDLACGAIKTIAYTISDSEDFTGTTPDGEEDFEGETPAATPANNEIWYTSTDGAVVTPNNSDVFGATITSNTYENGKGVITFDGPVTEVGTGAFSGGTLASITFPESVTTIAVQAITEHHGTLESFGGKFATEDGRCLIVDGKLVAFASAGLAEYTLPETVTIIGSSAFESSGIANVEIPNSVVALEPGAFVMSGVTSVIIPGSVKTLGETTFTMSRNLAEVVFSEGVKTVELRAFYGCSKLAKVTIPASMTAIHDHAFAETALTSVTFPEQFSSLGGNAFASCAALAAVYCKAVTPPSTANEGWYDWFDGNADGRKIYVPAESVAAYKAADGWSEYADAIVGYDFEKGEIVEEVVPAEPANNEIWYTTTNGQAYEYFTIDASDFGANLVSNEYVDGKGILTFDGDVTGVYFDGPGNIETLTLPASVEDGFLRYCNNLKQINGHLASEDGRCFVVDGVVKGFAPSGLTEYTFPQGITKIGGVKDSAQTEVLGCAAAIMKFVFPDGLTEIGYYAFGERLNSGASSGLVVELPSTLTTIADNAFCAAGLEQITLPANLKTIGNNAFNYNSLTSVVVSSNVTSIGDGAFGSNSELSSVTVEATNPCSIGSNVFLGCSDALNINVPSGNWKAYAYDDSWGEYAYYMRVDGEVPAFDKIPSFQIWYTTSDGKECQLYDTKVFGATLVSNVYENGKGVITFNGAVAQIGLCAFYGNTAARQTLTSITIPAFVRSIGEAAIANHPNLTAIYCTRTTPPTGADDMFLKDDYSIPYDGTIYVPTESVNAYKAAAYWSEYADKIVGYDFE